MECAITDWIVANRALEEQAERIQIAANREREKKLALEKQNQAAAAAAAAAAQNAVMAVDPDNVASQVQLTPFNSSVQPSEVCGYLLLLLLLLLWWWWWVVVDFVIHGAQSEGLRCVCVGVLLSYVYVRV